MTWVTIYNHLGYLEAPSTVPSTVPVPLTAIANKLDSLDTQLETAIIDSMAVKVGELTIDYNQHINHLRTQGTRWLKQLSHLAAIPIAYDKYTAKVPGDIGDSPLAVRSY